MKKISDLHSLGITGKFWPGVLAVFFLINCGLIKHNNTFVQEYIKRVDIEIEMSDGTNLLADIYLPDTLNRYPTILIRNPYNKNYLKIFGEKIVGYGYAVVLQDVRGKYGSEGIFTVFANEKRDGLETLDWIIEQAWSDGIAYHYATSDYNELPTWFEEYIALLRE